MMKRIAQASGPFVLCLGIASILALTARDASAENFRFQWSARFSAAEQFDDNIYLDDDNKEQDWITYLTPGLTLSLLTEETTASLSYDLSLVGYAGNDEQSEVRHGLTLSGFQGIPVAEHLTLDLDASLRVSEDPFEIGNVEQDVTRTAPGRYYSSNLGGRLNFFFGPEDFAYAGFEHSLMINEDSGTEDRQEYRPSAGLTYWFSTRYGSSIAYSYANADYDVSNNYEEHLAAPSLLCRITPRTQANANYSYDQLDYDGTRTDYVVHTFTLGLNHQFSSATEGSISGGYLIIDPERGDQNGSFAGSFSLSHTLQRASVFLDGSAGYRRQFFETENLGLSLYGRASVSFTYQLQERLSAFLTGTYYRDDYQETPQERLDTTWMGGVGLNYTFLPWLNGGIVYDYRQRLSDIGVDEYVDNRVTVRFTAAHSGAPRPL
jgi:hypothetical protein